MTEYFDIANVAIREMVLGQMTNEIMTVTKYVGDIAISLVYILALLGRLSFLIVTILSYTEVCCTLLVGNNVQKM